MGNYGKHFIMSHLLNDLHNDIADNCFKTVP